MTAPAEEIYVTRCSAAAGRSQQASQRQRSDQGGSPTTEDMACTLADREFSNSHSLRWGVCTKRSPCAVTISSDSALGLTRRREILAWGVNAHGGALGSIEASYIYSECSTKHMRRLHNWLQVEIEGRTLQLHLEQACAARYLHPRHPALLLSPLLCTVCALEIEDAGPSVRPLCLFDRKLCWAAEQPPDGAQCYTGSGRYLVSDSSSRALHCANRAIVADKNVLKVL